MLLKHQSHQLYNIMERVFLKSLVMSIYLLTSFNSHASSNYSDIGIHFGGAKIDRVKLAGAGSVTDIKTGDVLSLSFGKMHYLSSKFDIQYGLGLRSNTAISERGDVEWRSEFIEFSIYHNTEYFRSGGGFQYYINPRLRGGTIDRNFENDIGHFLALEYKFQPNIYIGLRITREDYTDTQTHENISGNTYGITVTIPLSSKLEKGAGAVTNENMNIY